MGVIATHLASGAKRIARRSKTGDWLRYTRLKTPDAGAAALWAICLRLTEQERAGVRIVPAAASAKVRYGRIEPNTTTKLP